ncbi:MAG: hypothetical protein KAR20_05830, partial [Candidatus Heimdallarchaeota archaeon]|nr:hypothetical protein [Candidatus Heimdallarchaeota archaeon]
LETLWQLQNSNSQKIIVKADKSGFIEGFSTKFLGWLLVELGGGRKKVTDEINPYVGFKKLRSIGEKVNSGDEIFELFVSKSFDLGQSVQICKKFRDCVQIGGSKRKLPLVSEIID